MRLYALGIAIAALAIGWILGGLLKTTPTSLAGEEVAAVRLELAEQRRTVEKLQQEIASLHERSTWSSGSIVREPTRDEPRITEAVQIDRNAPPSSLDPRELLARYIASFDEGGQGSEFFRLGVAAYAWTLRLELAALINDHRLPANLRTQVIEMFGTPVFRQQQIAIDALIEVLTETDLEALARTSLAALGRIGDQRTAEALAHLCSSLQSLGLRQAVWETLLGLAGSEADRLLLRLFEQERAPEGRMAIIPMFRGIGTEDALRAYELASNMEREVRSTAADGIGEFRQPPFVDLTENWAGRENDKEIRDKLLAALDHQKQIPRWHELQIVGPPNVPDPRQDHEKAWAPQTADGGREWIEASYDEAIDADRITIYETCTSGGVIEVEVVSTNGARRTVWSGNDPTTSPGPFDIRFSRIAKVHKVRIHLDTSLNAGYDEIDAVELSGPGRSAWASGAIASSRYGSRSSRLIEAEIGSWLSGFEGR